MLFADTYRNIAYNRNYGFACEDSEKRWKQFNKVSDITDLISLVDRDEIPFDYILKGYISFQGSSLFQQYLGYEATNLKFTMKFNPSSITSYLELIKLYSLDTAVADYTDAISIEDDEDEEMNDVSEIDRVLKKLKDKLFIMSVCNNSEFQRMMIEIIENYYRMIKYNSKFSPTDVSEIDSFLIQQIETEDIEEIIQMLLNNEIELAYMLNKYLSHKSLGGWTAEECDDISFDRTIQKIRTYSLTVNNKRD